MDIKDMRASWLEAVANGEAEGFSRSYVPDILEALELARAELEKRAVFTPRLVNKMGIRLYIDDLRKEPSGWVRAKTVTEAIRILATREVDEISLDHDIATECCGCVKSSWETFEAVAWFIAAQRQWGKEYPKITLHTANPEGAKKMAEILADAGIEATVALNMPVNGLE